MIRDWEEHALGAVPSACPAQAREDFLGLEENFVIIL